MLAAQDDDPLHDARIAIRRGRSLLRLFSGSLPVSRERSIAGLPSWPCAEPDP